jgi:hypothetical protein
MRGRLLLAGFGVVAGVGAAVAQMPPPLPQPPAQAPPPYRPLTPPIQIPKLPEPKQQAQPPAVAQPMPLAPTQPGLPDGSTLPPPTEVVLPYPEDKFPLDSATVTMKRINGSWQVWAGQRLLRDLGNDERAAQDVTRTLRELHPTEWARIGSPRPVVEYGLVNGRPPIVGGFPRMLVPIDLKTVRVEPVKGVWCLRDDGGIHFNFGSNRADADQALAVVQKYGFNRIGLIGPHTAPAMAYLFVNLEADKGGAGKGVRPAGGSLTAAAQEMSLTRTGIPVPGVGYVGEMIKIDPRKVETRREHGDWVVAYGPEVLARFGPWEWTARDAVRAIQDGKFTEFCKVGSAGLTFFLSNGKAPTKVPFAAQGRRFNPGDLKVQSINDRWAVTEGGRHLFDVGGPEEGEQLIRLLRHFQFDQLCLLGQNPKAGLQFLAKGR